MTHFIRFVNSSWLYFLVPLILMAAILVYMFKKQIVYRYSLGAFLAKKSIVVHDFHKKFFYGMRLLLLLVLALVCARPQMVDSNSEITVEGIDIVLALDVSGSMRNQDFEHDPRTRLDIAKEEAIRFIKKRSNDAIGLVIFGNDALSRCPITHDKKLLEEMIDQVQLGIIDPDGTHLATSLITAASRLKYSKAKSKVIILLTDGHPSEGDVNPEAAIQVARYMGIKVYTIGIGHDEPWEARHPFFGAVMMPPTIDSVLLKKIAQETQGRFFVAHNAQEMQEVYAIIDRLEKAEIVVPLFGNQYEVGFIGIVISLVLLAIEICMSTTIWFGLYI